MGAARISEASMALARAGTSAAEIARNLQPPLTRYTVAKMLSGRWPIRADVLPTIARVAGEQVALEVERAIGGADV